MAIVTITITDYNSNNLYYTIAGGSISSIRVQRSDNDGVSWANTYIGPSVNPVTGQTTTGYSWFRILSEDYTVVSNIWDTETPPVEAPTPTLTAISNENQIYFCNSPIHLRLQNALTDASIQSVLVYLYMWRGSQNAPPETPNVTLSKTKVSQSDTYINLEISDYLKSFLIGDDNQPNFAFNELDVPAITGQGVFWQVVAEITSTDATVTTQYQTNFVTLGYRYNYEQNAIRNNGVTPYGSLGFQQNISKWFNPKVKNYFNQNFDLTKTIEEATTSNIIVYTDYEPTSAQQRCTLDPTIIVYLNKLGLWEQFTPQGKIVVSSKIDSDTSNRGFRDPSQIDNSYIHSKMRTNLDVTQTWMINTGRLDESDVQAVEEIILSPKVYLIRFKGDVYYPDEIGVTVDSTYITVDDTTITVDNKTVAIGDVGYFKTFQQIPVIVTDSDFGRKTRLNDKNAIDYNIKFDETNNKINNIR